MDKVNKKTIATDEVTNKKVLRLKKFEIAHPRYILKTVIPSSINIPMYAVRSSLVIFFIISIAYTVHTNLPEAIQRHAVNRAKNVGL